jgi:hypothetical protein
MTTRDAQLPALPEFVPCRAVRRALGGACNATIRAMIEDGQLPKPIKPRANMMLFERGALLAAIERMRATA